MICKDCVLFEHIQHINECKQIKRETVIRYIKKSLKKLYAKNQEIIKLIETLGLLKRREININSKDFINLVENLQENIGSRE